jgi:Enoyl-CoA hydratase/isomerase
MALRPVIDEHFGKNDPLSIMASLTGEDRPQYMPWAAETLATLRKRSPLSVAVTLEGLRRGRSQSLAACLRMELDLVMNCFDQGDIMEGIRAVLVDKDHAPIWRHAGLEAVPHTEVLAFFARRWAHGTHPLAHLVSTRSQ